jgi:hypothetical protein
MGLKAGDLVFFAGRGLVSNVIQLATYSLPNRGFSHVAIVGMLHGRPLLYESTSFPRGECVRTGKVIKGVQAHWPEDLIGTDDGNKSYHVPLRQGLYSDEAERLCWLLDQSLGRGYDMIGAARSGGFFLKQLCALLHRECDETLFCSELCSQVLIEVGAMQCPNYSAWSPMSLYRRLLRQGVVDEARRID